MTFALCLRIGCTIAELGARMSSREFAKWRAFYLKSPFDDQGAFHLPVAILSSMTANMNRAKGSPPHKVVDFMPFAEKIEESIDDQLLAGDW